MWQHQADFPEILRPQNLAASSRSNRFYANGACGNGENSRLQASPVKDKADFTEIKPVSQTDFQPADV